MLITTARCPVCGASTLTCGGHPEVDPIDPDTFLTRTETTMQEAPQLRTYTYLQNGYETTAQLTEADAQRLGAQLIDDGGTPPSPPAPAGKARKSTANK